MINRIWGSAIDNTKKSMLLLGPRQTGKSTLIKSLDIDLTINFADQETFLNHTQDFGLLKNEIEKKDILSSYSANYINEEIKAEALVRDLPSFSRFLQLSPEFVGEFVDYSKLSKKSKISRHQVPRYFEIFEDTMVGYRIFPDKNLLEKHDLIKHSKFYFFDVGVYNGLQKSYQFSADRAGVLSEQVVFQQLIHSAAALRKNIMINSLRTRGGAEIDFWIHLDSKNLGIEVKSSDKIIEDDVRHLVHFKKIEPKADYYLFHFGKAELKKNGIWCLPLGTGLKEIGL